METLLPRQRLLLIAACFLGLLVLAGIAIRVGAFPPARTADVVGGPFQLIDQTGRPVDEKVLKGHWNVVFFGYTYCPDVCPGTMQTLRATKDQLGSKGKDLRVVFISVDPGRDTPAAIQDWLSAQDMPAGTLGLTGTPDQVAAAARVYRVPYGKIGDEPGYQVQHPTIAYLMTPRGRFSRVLAYGLTPEQMADQIRRAMRGD